MWARRVQEAKTEWLALGLQHVAAFNRQLNAAARGAMKSQKFWFLMKLQTAVHKGDAILLLPDYGSRKQWFGIHGFRVIRPTGFLRHMGIQEAVYEKRKHMWLQAMIRRVGFLPETRQWGEAIGGEESFFFCEGGQAGAGGQAVSLYS